MYFSSVTAGPLIRSKYIVFTKRWDFSGGTRFQTGVKTKLRADRTDATHSNHVCAMDFVHDQLATAQKIRILMVVDKFSRFSPAVDARFGYRGEDVVQTLERICHQIGYPAVIRVDNGSEFISCDLGLWAHTIREWCSTSPGPASRQITAISRASMASSEPSV